MNDGMTRSPLLRLPNAREAVNLKNWLDDRHNFDDISRAFNSESRFARLKESFLVVMFIFDSKL